MHDERSEWFRWPRAPGERHKTQKRQRFSFAFERKRKRESILRILYIYLYLRWRRVFYSHGARHCPPTHRFNNMQQQQRHDSMGIPSVCKWYITERAKYFICPLRIPAAAAAAADGQTQPRFTFLQIRMHATAGSGDYRLPTKGKLWHSRVPVAQRRNGG